MSRNIKGNKPKNYADAVYLLQRGRLKVRGARTMQDAIAKLKDQYGGGDDGPGEDPPEGDNYGEWSKAQLQAELKKRDLPHSGNVDELVGRLQDADADDGEWDDDEDDD